jgi:hypothetical protein
MERERRVKPICIFSKFRENSLIVGLYVDRDMSLVSKLLGMRLSVIRNASS